MSSARPQRRTQGERAAETRLRLIEATLDLLMERGYSRATTADIAERAGLTRGAVSHHFHSKDDLVVQAVEHLLAASTAEIRDLAGLVQGGAMSLSGFIDRLWAMFSGRLFLITLEHVTEARHNALLKGRLVPVVREFHRALDEIWRSFFAASGLSVGEIETRLNATLCLLRGMGVQTVLRDDPAYYQRLLAWWKGDLRHVLDTAPLSASPRIRALRP